jgi:hypothetical protein
VGVVLQHVPGDVTGDCHDGSVTGLPLGKLRDRVMPETEATVLVRYVADETAESGKRQRQVVNAAGKLIRRAT